MPAFLGRWWSKGVRWLTVIKDYLTFPGKVYQQVLYRVDTWLAVVLLWAMGLAFGLVWVQLFGRYGFALLLLQLIVLTYYGLVLSWLWRIRSALFGPLSQCLGKQSLADQANRVEGHPFPFQGVPSPPSNSPGEADISINSQNSRSTDRGSPIYFL